MKRKTSRDKLGQTSILQAFGIPTAKRQATDKPQDDKQIPVQHVSKPLPVHPSVSSAAKGPNAFSAMMAASKAATSASRTESFSLRFESPTPGGTAGDPPCVTWSWEAASRAPSDASATWTGSCKVKQPDGVGPAGTRPHVLVHLSTNVPSAEPGPATTSADGSKALPPGADPAVRVSPSILKSCLQKAVRRGMADSAVAMAKEMWARDAPDLIRRLPIIIVEDIGFLHPGLPVLVWLMLACASGYRPSAVHGAAVLAIVRSMAESKYQDVTPRQALKGSPQASNSNATSAGSSLAHGHGHDDDADNATDDVVVLDDDDHEDGGHDTAGHHDGSAAGAGSSHAASAGKGSKQARPPLTRVMSHHLDVLSQQSACLIRCLIARASFGGMKGDVVMLLRAVELWWRRFSHDELTGSAAGAGASSSSAATAGATGAARARGASGLPDNRPVPGDATWVAPMLPHELVAGAAATAPINLGSRSSQGQPTWTELLQALYPDAAPQERHTAAAASSGSAPVPMAVASVPSSSSSASLPTATALPRLLGPWPPLSSIPRLKVGLMPLAGVDFHCSNILVEVLGSSDPRAVQAREVLGQAGIGRHAGGQQQANVAQAHGVAMTAPHGGTSGLLVEAMADALSSLMWQRRSGVNWRKPFPSPACTSDETASATAQYHHDTAVLAHEQARAVQAPGAQAGTQQRPSSSVAPSPPALPPSAAGVAYGRIEPLLDPCAAQYLSHRMPAK